MQRDFALSSQYGEPPLPLPPPPFFRTQLFCLQLEASCSQWSFLLTVDSFSFSTYNWSFFAYNFSFFSHSWSFFAYSGKVRLARALRDCKQRSLTVSKKAPAVSKKRPPFFLSTRNRDRLSSVRHWRRGFLPKRGQRSAVHKLQTKQPKWEGLHGTHHPWPSMRYCRMALC